VSLKLKSSVLFVREQPAASAREAIAWWEARLPNPPHFVFLGMLSYGFAANICYTGGWLAELAIRKILPAQSDRLAILSFKFGLAFSILLSLFPAFIFGGFDLIAAWPHIFGSGH